MPNCVVKGCNKQSSKNKKPDGITFHTFPVRDENIKEKWIEVIRASRNEPLWRPSLHSVVCSAHFESDDLYYTKNGLRRVLRNGYPKILPVVPERLDNVELRQSLNDHQPAPLEQSDDLSFSQSTTIYSARPPTPDPLFLDVKPSTSCAYELVTPDRSYDLDLNKHSTTHAQLSTIPVQSVQDSSNFDTHKKHKLRKRMLFLETTHRQNKRKIKTLYQKIRRLEVRNKSLRKILGNLKKQNYLDTDLINSLNGNIVIVDVVNALNRKNLKKNFKYTPTMKKFCLTLNYLSPKAYEYVRVMFNTCLPHSKTLAKWDTHIKEEPSSADESLQPLKTQS